MPLQARTLGLRIDCERSRGPPIGRDRLSAFKAYLRLGLGRFFRSPATIAIGPESIAKSAQMDKASARSVKFWESQAIDFEIKTAILAEAKRKLFTLSTLSLLDQCITNVYKRRYLSHFGGARWAARQDSQSSDLSFK